MSILASSPIFRSLFTALPAFIILCATQAVDEYNISFSATSDNSTANTRNILPRAAANASSKGYRERTSEIIPEPPQAAVEGHGTNVVDAGEERGHRLLNSSSTSTIKTVGRRQDPTTPVPAQHRPSLGNTCAATHGSGVKGEPSSATATSSSDCQTTGDDGGFHQDQRDGGGGDGDSAEIDGDDHESGRHATGLRSDMEHTGSEKTESHSVDPWGAYEVLTEADPVTSWDVLRQARLSYYTFMYDKREGRRRLGVLPPDVATLIPEAFSTFTLPVTLPNGSRTKVDGVPNVDWTYLFSHTVTVTQVLYSAGGAIRLNLDHHCYSPWNIPRHNRQELARRLNGLENSVFNLGAKSGDALSKMTRLMERQGMEWQPAARLRDLAAVSELERDIMATMIAFEKTVGQERRRSLQFRHNQTLATSERELELARARSEEHLNLTVHALEIEYREVFERDKEEEATRRSTELTLLLLDQQAANQSAHLANHRKLSETLASVREVSAAERGGEQDDMARIRARGEETRKRAQAVVDETFNLLGNTVLAALSQPAKLLKTFVGLLGIALTGLVVINATSLAGRALRQRVAKPTLVRESDVPGTISAVVEVWISRVMQCLSCAVRCCAGCAFERGEPLPHILIHGVAGSGKTLLAQRFASMCGLKYAVVSGGDVGPLGSNASYELGRLMRWAGAGTAEGGAARGAGTALVLDGAEAVLGNRSRRLGMSENARSALNAVLLHTGEPHPGFMMVLVTSRPQDLDEAVLDRVDEVLHLPRPKLPERTRLVCQYFKKHLHHDAPPMVFVNGGEHGPRRKREGGNTKFPSPEKELASNIPLCPETVNGDSPSATVGTMTNSNRLQSALATGICADSMSSTGSATKKCQETIDENNTDVCGDALAQKESATKNRSTKRKRWIERFTTWRKQYKVTRAGRSEPAASGWRGMKPVLLSEEFLEKKEILVRGFVSKSEGFYGRDIARFFLALQAVVYASEACTLTETMWISTERRKLSEFAEREALIHKADNTGVRDEKTAKMSESGHQPRSNNNAYALHTRHEDDCAQSGVRCQETRTETAASMSHKNSDSTLGSSPPAVPKAVGLTSKPPATALITDSCQRIVATDNEMTPKLIADNPCPRLRDACCSRGRTCAGERAERANIASAVVDPAPSSDPEITRPEW